MARVGPRSPSAAPPVPPGAPPVPTAPPLGPLPAVVCWLAVPPLLLTVPAPEGEAPPPGPSISLRSGRVEQLVAARNANARSGDQDPTRLIGVMQSSSRFSSGHSQTTSNAK